MEMYDADGNPLTIAQAQQALAAAMEVDAGAGPHAGAVGGAAAGGNVVVQTTGAIKVNLTSFSGQEGSAGTISWLKACERAFVQTRFTDAQKAAAALSYFKDDAKTWADSLELEGEPADLAALHDWPRLTLRIKEAFVRRLSTAEIIDARASLRQKPTENVHAFWHRCVVATHNLSITTKPVAGDPRYEGYRAEKTREIKLNFISGLQQNVRSALVAFDIDIVTPDELRLAAMNAELNARHKAKEDAPTTTPNLRVDAVGPHRGSGQRGQRGGRGFRGYRGSGRGGGGRGAGSYLADREKLLCPRCGMLALHRGPECYVNLERLRANGRGRFAPRQQARGAANTIENNADAIWPIEACGNTNNVGQQEHF